MKVLAINGSPNADKGNTNLILDCFLIGLAETGAQIETLYTKKLKVAPCMGTSCLRCWNKHPGVCRHKDSMTEIYPKLREADILVIATPVFVDGMTGPMKMFLDRMIPIVEPFIEVRDGHFRHVLPKANKRGQIVLVSTAGFVELDNFDPLVAHVKAISKNIGREFAGALLRPAGPALKFPSIITASFGLKIKRILVAAKDAGKELGSTGVIKEDTLKIVSEEIMHPGLYRRTLNWSFHKQRKKNKDI